MTGPQMLQEIAKRMCLPVGGTDTEEAYRAGQDYAKNGATTENCHFRFFGSKELMQAWEHGSRESAC